MLKLDEGHAQADLRRGRSGERPRFVRSSVPPSSVTSLVRLSGSGIIKRGTKARLVRDGVVVANELSIESLRREKDDVTEVREGYECGINLGFKDIAEGDVIETWEMREKAACLRLTR